MSKNGRVIIVGTKENIRHLFKLKTWYLDGTFDTVSTIFSQVFAVLDNMKQFVKGEEDVIGIPFVYALLDSKEEAAYATVLQKVIDAAGLIGINTRLQFVMSDFELSIINACNKVLDTSEVKACLFHLKLISSFDWLSNRATPECMLF